MKEEIHTIMVTIFLLLLPSRQGYNCWNYRMFIKLLFFEVLVTVVYSETIFLNSCENCLARKEYEIKSEFGYLVNTSPTEELCQRECRVRVSSTNNDSWLCLSQVGLISQINDSNAELFIYDTANENSPLIHLQYFPDTWSLREICKKTNFLDFSLRKVNRRRSLDLEKLRVQLKVHVIESRNRTVYFDGNYCSTEYKLLNSVVNIYNQPEDNDPVTYGHTLTNKCGIPVEMVEVNDISVKKICFVYIPSNHINCENNWTFSVSLVEYSLQPSDMAYTLNCRDKEAQEKQFWCAESGVHKVTLILKRDKEVNKSTEHPKMFHIVILDYNGTVESLKVEAQKFKEAIDLPEYASSTPFLFILIPIISVIIIIMVIYGLHKQHKLPCGQYQHVHQRSTIQCDSKVNPNRPPSV